eukprot:Skav216757  [mRNA]  locus=scaffold3303:12117:15736:- [translate_table: standard]
MLRNLPNNYTRDMFLSLLDEEGLSGLYDFVNSAAVDKAWKTFNGFDRWALPTAKVCQVGWSGPHQGFEAHVERYRNSPVMHKSANIVVKGSFIDMDDHCLVRQYRKLRRVMSDSCLAGVLDVPEVYEPGRFSNDFAKATQTQKERGDCVRSREKTPVAIQHKSQKNQVKEGKVAQVEEGSKNQRTTVMLRNLPNNYTRDMFLSLLDEEGLSGLYDFVYLPMDFRRDANLGYAFVNLVKLG